jgi:hypothetical protein
MQRIPIHIFCDTPGCDRSEILWTEVRSDGDYNTVVPHGWCYEYHPPYPDEDAGEHKHYCAKCAKGRGTT